ncbi:ATP-binding cassette domain-containing protein [Limnobacter humi]|uniref:ATP-binding cassette domain-containing protein n=1 Tax=Limnobacter humi TaxID=1778671 RepID=A0ABT1WEL7_9BURK|nr:ATP-binding cassette domain-containing protein [Limnobacter humi]MCQ8895328.1 ATP-binding cassette domain-containing protein [Limnobacter humi]
MAQPPVLQLDNVVKRYGAREVLKGLNLAVHRGECVALLGPNGAGKSTTVSLALGLSVATAGRVQLLGYDMGAQGHLARAQVGVVPQYDSLDPDFTVIENLQVYGRYFSLQGAVLRERAIELLGFARLSDRRDDAVSALSGGMRRRLMLARSLVNGPQMLFLDEPTTGLDPTAKHGMWDGLLALKRQGMAILLTTHDMDEAERLADRVAVLNGGVVVALDTPRALIETHVGTQVLEVWGAGAAAYLNDRLGVAATEQEHRGEMVFLRNETASRALERIRVERPAEVECLFRPGNLEDVFFRLTGRALDRQFNEGGEE